MPYQYQVDRRPQTHNIHNPIRPGLIDAPNLVKVGAMTSISPTNHRFGLIVSKVLVHPELGNITRMYALAVLNLPLGHTGKIGYIKKGQRLFFQL